MEQNQKELVVSIIVPIYNVEKYIQRCVESLVGQSYPKIEVILVNDGATDGSVSIIKKYVNDSRVVIINKENGGLSSARNAGMDVMSGNYIMFVDGDDYLDTDAVEKLVEHVQDGSELILFPYIREFELKKEKTELFNNEYIFFDKRQVRDEIFAKLVGPHNTKRGHSSPANMDRLNTAWGKLYKRELIENIRFTDTQVIGPEDCWFNVQALFRCKTAKYISDVFYHYEKTNQNSLLHKYNNNLCEKRWRMYDLVSVFLCKHNLNELHENLNNRIVCEQFGLLQNVWLSNLSKKSKRKCSLEIIKDKRYIELYKKIDFNFIERKWHLFYWLCKKKNNVAIEILFWGYKAIKSWKQRKDSNE